MVSAVSIAAERYPSLKAVRRNGTPGRGRKRNVKHLESIEDEMRGTVTYDLGNGRFATFDARTVREYGLAALMRAYDIEMPTERLPAIQYGRRIGTMPPDFDPANIRSMSFMYDPRPGDFRREGDTWVASRTMGASDVDCVAGFVRDV
jgi:hypothetical protein